MYVTCESLNVLNSKLWVTEKRKQLVIYMLLKVGIQ